MSDARSSEPRPRGGVNRVGLFLAAALTIAVYFGFVLAWRRDKPDIVTPANSAIGTAVQADLYALQARGFLKGQLHLDLEAPPALVAAANPYDPAQRPPVLYLHDSSLFRGRYYMYFGPAPALLLFAPWRLVTGHDLPTPYAVGVFASIAYLGLLVLFRAIARTYYPHASRVAVWSGIVALSGATMLLPLVRRPAVYEVAISCGCAAAVWGFYCAWRARSSPRAAGWAAACGTLFGLAVAARPTFGLGACAALGLMLTERKVNRSHPFRMVFAAASCGAVLVGALLAYNYARFDDPLQFGQKYQLSSAEEGAIQHFSPRFVATQAWFYLLAPLRLTSYFPFFNDVTEPDLPAGFGAHEYSFGVFANFPFAWFILPALAAIWLRRPARAVLVVLALGALLALAPLLFFFGSCVRYQAEFTPLLMLLASCGALEADALALRCGPRSRTALAVLALMLAGVSSVVALLSSVDLYNPSAHASPQGFDSIGRWLNRPVIALEQARGERHGPVRLRLQLGRGIGQREALLVAEGPDGAREAIYIERVDSTSARLIVRREGSEEFERTALVSATEGATHELTVSMSSLYPLRAIELPTRMSRDRFRALKIWLRVEWDGRRVLDEALPMAPWRTARVAIAPRDGAGEVAPFSGRILAQERQAPPSSAERQIFGGVRLKFALNDRMAERSLPLAVTGRHGRGNFLFMKVLSEGQVQFGYDHWGKPVILSAPAALPVREFHVLEFWMPSMLSASEASPLIVALNGKTIWSTNVPFYPAGADEVFIARNPLGGSACEREFPGAEIETTRLPPR